MSRGENTMNRYIAKVSDLEHSGIKGQKWGVRRYQNPDGSLTDEGRRRYGSGIREGQRAKLYKDYDKGLRKARKKGMEDDYRKTANKALDQYGFSKKERAYRQSENDLSRRLTKYAVIGGVTLGPIGVLGGTSIAALSSQGRALCQELQETKAAYMNEKAVKNGQKQVHKIVSY